MDGLVVNFRERVGLERWKEQAGKREGVSELSV